MKVSVVLATYNGEKYLQEQLDSLLKQTRQPDELIITDDASTDKTIEIIEKFKINCPFHVHLHQNDNNLGYKLNFTNAVQIASGDVIFYCDQDDVWFNNKIEVVLNDLMQKPDILCVTNNVKVIGEGVSIDSYFTFLEVNGSDVDRFVKGCATAFTSEAKAILFPVQPAFGWAHDDWVNFCSSLLGRRYIEHEVLQEYRLHGENASALIEKEKNALFKWMRHRRDSNNNQSKSCLDVIRYISPPRINGVESWAAKVESRLVNQTSRNNIINAINKKNINYRLRENISHQSVGKMLRAIVNIVSFKNYYLFDGILDYLLSIRYGLRR